MVLYCRYINDSIYYRYCQLYCYCTCKQHAVENGSKVTSYSLESDQVISQSCSCRMFVIETKSSALNSSAAKAVMQMPQTKELCLVRCMDTFACRMICGASQLGLKVGSCVVLCCICQIN